MKIHFHIVEKTLKAFSISIFKFSIRTAYLYFIQKLFFDIVQILSEIFMLENTRLKMEKKNF